MGCDVRYLNDSYRLNGLKATAAQQVSLSPAMRQMSAFQLCRPRSSSRNRTAEKSFFHMAQWQTSPNDTYAEQLLMFCVGGCMLCQC